MLGTSIPRVRGCCSAPPVCPNVRDDGYDQHRHIPLLPQRGSQTGRFMSWLITGGAGFIGAHVVRAFLAAGCNAVVLEDLSSGSRSFVPATVPFVEGPILDGGLLEDPCDRYRVSGVVHLAGFKYAGISVQRPLHTYQQNVQ